MEYLSFEQLLARDGKLVYTNKGVSMMPLVREHRDVLIIEKRDSRPLRRLDVVLFHRNGVRSSDAYVLHRILRVNGDGTYWIVGDNCFFGETVADGQIFGILTAVQKNGKTVFMSNLGVRLYGHLWSDFWPVRFFILRMRNFIVRYAKAAKRRLSGK